MNDEKISIVVPIYKVENDLDRCVKSILGQTYKNIEVILVDDGSPDRCPELCDAYAKRDTRVQVIHKTNGGLSEARNFGLDKASGDYIAFVDSDDWVAPDFIETLYENAVKEDADISIVGYTLVWPNGRKKEYKGDGESCVLNQEEAIKELLLQRKFQCMVCQKMYKTEIFRNVKFPVGTVYEDVAVSLPTFLKARKVVVAGKAKYFYWQREGSIVNSRFDESKMSIIDFCKDIIKYSDSNNKMYDIESHVFYLRALLMVVMQASQDVNTNKKVIRYIQSEIFKSRKYIFNNQYLEFRKKVVLFLLSVNFPPRILAWVWRKHMEDNHKSEGEN